MFLLESTHIGGQHPPNSSAPPQWEILDPPLLLLLLLLLLADLKKLAYRIIVCNTHTAILRLFQRSETNLF